MIEQPDAPNWGDLSADDPEEAGDLGPTARRPREASAERPAREGGALRTAVATAQPIMVELTRDLFAPLDPWTYALGPERAAELSTYDEGERWVVMVREALNRDMEADDARDPEHRHYDFPHYFYASFKTLRGQGEERAQRRAIATAIGGVAQALWADPALRLTAERLAAHLACTQDELAAWLGVTPERLAAEDAGRQAAWISTVDIHSTAREEDGDA